MLSQRFQNKDQRENELLSEVHTYQRQIQNLNRNMEQMENAFKQSTLARERMMNDYNTMKNVVDTFDIKK